MISSQTCTICKDAAGIAGNIFAFGLFMSPIPTYRRIIRNQSTEQFSGLPYIYALLNCLICAWYGTPLISFGNILVTTVNSVGAVFQLIYLILFIIYAERAKKLRMSALLLAVFGLLAAIVVVSLNLSDRDMRRMFVGFLSGASLISMFASPLFIINLVIRTRSVEFMPFYLSLSTFLMSASFFLYGFFNSDPFIYVPNGMGTILGICHTHEQFLIAMLGLSCLLICLLFIQLLILSTSPLDSFFARVTEWPASLVVENKPTEPRQLTFLTHKQGERVLSFFYPAVKQIRLLKSLSRFSYEIRSRSGEEADRGLFAISRATSSFACNENGDLFRCICGQCSARNVLKIKGLVSSPLLDSSMLLATLVLLEKESRCMIIWQTCNACKTMHRLEPVTLHSLCLSIWKNPPGALWASVQYMHMRSSWASTSGLLCHVARSTKLVGKG
ncbi:hypothetical protein F0562_010527 [Nyssa sinensis]|uniref:Bidirectional sugar transporter SWEET n=1 Tax=Nyssa sinensis TaxID=561372 RepID=A0A5J5A2N6_9ASTE|nr:hypothetical protein F0562_010527 [Nyssa sinensis]